MLGHAIQALGRQLIVEPSISVEKRIFCDQFSHTLVKLRAAVLSSPGIRSRPCNSSAFNSQGATAAMLTQRRRRWRRGHLQAVQMRSRSRQLVRNMKKTLLELKALQVDHHRQRPQQGQEEQ
jgi:hypothetical protein